MKRLKEFTLPILALVFLASCSSVKVVTDYDKEADFNTYKTYAFYKTGIDKAEISDLDKKRILKAIDAEMAARGFAKSKQPDVLVSIFTKERERVDVYNNNFGFGWGGFGWGGFGWGGGFYNPWLFGPGFGWGGGFGPNVSTRTEGSLYIDVIDSRKRELVWQGRGVGTLNNIKNIEKKEKRIKQFVAEILEKYPTASQLASN
ncbi:DUF4136 domain-containing protein [Flagellimonas meridianipacifica]|uniref:Uncharacterized protein DUF4136 n=1 Tax=Flagellimonas meridianipacifica TaxID=1080225 RepID=A0A2T0MEQ9_9FLAO|nr:DUF4136 domain-containing protein [Allomuricauda pacifica]PRX56060.1 uncharacterized protein DUF4136 [Allomuricauda pacifica]